MTEAEIYKILDEECRDNGAINPHKAAKILAERMNIPKGYDDRLSNILPNEYKNLNEE